MALHRVQTRAQTLLALLVLGLTPITESSLAQTAIDETASWPRTRSTNGNTVTMYCPSVERWTSNSFTARAAVELRLAGAKSDLLGVVWFDAHGSVNRSNRMVTLDRFEITKGRFPDAKDNGSNALAAIQELIPAGARTVSLDYLITSLGFAQAAARKGSQGLKHDPPSILWVTNRAVLVLIDGEPLLRPVPGSSLQRVVNTPALLVKDSSGKFYLSGESLWFMADSLQGPWELTRNAPAEIAALHPAAQSSAEGSDEDLPRIIISTAPAELLVTRGFPDFRSIRGTSLQYAADSDSQLFFYSPEREAYLLLSGRWFKAKSLHGPWSYAAPRDLPADFAKIPLNTPQAVVLASVPNTPQADLALLANSVPTMATINRKTVTVNPVYDGEPQFKPIEGTSMAYAVNADLPVIRTADDYCALEDGVWFLASSAKGPWGVATEVPPEIYTIPPSSPVYYVTYARIYDASDDEVEAGYSPGYQGAYEDDGTVVYGTGYDYQPWCGTDYYGWGWTWGYSYTYVPWYQWWVWRPWWTPPGGLRAAIIENVYNRWQSGNQVVHYGGSAGSWPSAPSAPSAASAGSAASADRSASADRAVSAQRAASAARAESAERAASATSAGSAAGSPGFPALYGRFRGSSRPAALTPPADTLVLNPYARPQSSVRSGEIPNGAQLLSSVRKAPGAGRDLYASPDGNVYRRSNDGWYRRDAGGGWSFYAPTQGKIERDQLTSGRAAQAGVGQAGGLGSVYRPMAGANAPGIRKSADLNRVPDTGSIARGQQVAALEREYYARTLAQMRAQQFQRTGRVSTAARPAVRRR